MGEDEPLVTREAAEVLHEIGRMQSILTDLEDKVRAMGRPIRPTFNLDGQPFRQLVIDAAPIVMRLRELDDDGDTPNRPHA